MYLGVPDPQGIAVAAREVLHQARNIGYIDSFWFNTINFVMMLPLLLLQVCKPKNTATLSVVNPE